MASKIDKLDECRDSLKLIKRELDEIEQFPADISVMSMVRENTLIRNVYRLLNVAHLSLAERTKE